MRVGLISNLRSQRNRRGIATLREIAAARGNILHRELEGIEGLETARVVDARDPREIPGHVHDCRA